MIPWRKAAILSAIWPFAAVSAPVIVTSGEHPGFTRLVMQFEGSVAWQVGRSIDGYSLRVQQQSPDYNIAKAFDLIGKSRLAAIWSDPKTGDLHFGIACTCYAMPFEFRPGIIVVDLRDGAPPKGSSFEHPLDSPATLVVPRIDIKPVQAVVFPAYNWTTATLERLGLTLQSSLNPALAQPPANNLLTIDPSLEPLRQSLIEEMSRGASQGIVDMAKPKAALAKSGAADPSVQIHLGETPGLIVRQKGKGRTAITAQGGACLSDDHLDVTSWGSDRPISDQIGPERQGLTGEFDKPDADAVSRAIRFHLFLGFGAEARELAHAFPDDLPDNPTWQSMAHILDDDADSISAFTGMEDCDGLAALWATLADPDARPHEDIGKSAVVRSFSALPAHLRRLLGPRLVDRFLAINDIAVATSLRDAILRARGDPGPGIILMQAAMNRALGKPGQSEAQLEPLASNSGPAAADALVDMVEQRVSLGQSVSFNQVQALESMLKEREGGKGAARYRHALLLAHAASGDFDKAFADIPEVPNATATLWQVLAKSGPDSALLAHATLAATDPLPVEAKDVASIIAVRMLGLGLADQAARWLTVDEKPPGILAARIKLAQGQAKAALVLLQSDDSPAALAVKAAALQALNDEMGAAEVFTQLGKTDEHWAALSRSKVWDALAVDGPEAWKAVASFVVPATNATANATAATDGALARNKALVQDSAAMRDAITALLDTVKTPVSPSQ